MATQRLRLPHDILVLIAEASIEIMDDAEIWFTLARVCCTFRAIVEKHILKDVEDDFSYSMVPGFQYTEDWRIKHVLPESSEAEEDPSVPNITFQSELDEVYFLSTDFVLDRGSRSKPNIMLFSSKRCFSQRQATDYLARFALGNWYYSLMGIDCYDNVPVSSQATRLTKPLPTSQRLKTAQEPQPLKVPESLASTPFSDELEQEIASVHTSSTTEQMYRIQISYDWQQLWTKKLVLRAMSSEHIHRHFRYEYSPSDELNDAELDTNTDCRVQ